MKFEFRSAFDRSLRKKSRQIQEKTRRAIDSILAYLEKRQPLRPGLGLKNFRGNYWEVRLDIHDRIIFQLSDRVIFWLVGNHDEICRFMKQK